MTKGEALIELKKKSKEGYITHSLILDIYDEGEEIPEVAQRMLWHLPEPPEPITIYMGKEGMKHMDKLFKEMYNGLQ